MTAHATGSRFLFVVPPLNGHVSPTLAVAAELVARGHQVAWTGMLDEVAHRLPPGATTFPLDAPGHTDSAARMREARKTARGAAALKLLWEGFFVPLARAMVPGVDEVVSAWAPDVLICDQQTFAGGLVARRRGLRWATSATTVAGVADPLGALPRVKAWVEALFADVQRDLDLEPVPDPGLSPNLVLCFWSELLAGATPGVRFVGPSIGARPAEAADDFPWSELKPGPRVLVSLGTVNAGTGARFYREVVAGLADHPAQVIIAAPPELVPEPRPDTMLVRGWVPQLRLLDHVDAVVCHAGQNTVAESLAAGLPLVMAPIKDDQPLVADQVVAAGAGLRVKFGRVRAARLRDAVTRVLDEPGFRAAASRVQADFAAAGGAVAAASSLEELATS